MAGPAPAPAPGAGLRDEHRSRQVVSHRRVWTGSVFAMDEDEVRVNDSDQPVIRQYVAHPGAVGVVAYREQDGVPEILLIRQYRHPVSAELWEVPAGLLDVEGEDPWEAARRELREEADLQARDWRVLVDYFTSPGGSQEALRLYLARDLTASAETFQRVDEERDMERRWVALSTVVKGVFVGTFHNPTTVVGALAVEMARQRGWDGLRTVDSKWMR